MAVLHEGDPALEGDRAREMDGGRPSAGRLRLEVLAGPAEQGRGACLVGGDGDTGDLCGIGPVQVHRPAAGVDHGDDRRDAPGGGLGSGGFRGAPRHGVRQCGDLAGSEVGTGAGEGHGLVLIARLATGADGAHDLTLDGEGDTAGQRDGTVEGEGTEPAAADLLLDLPAGSHEDGGGAGLVDGHPVAGDLGAIGAGEAQQVSPWVDDGGDDAVALVAGGVLGGVHHRLGAGQIEDAPGAVHAWGAPFGPWAARTAAQMSVSVVMKRTFASGPPNVKFTVPGSWISPMRSPLGWNTCTPVKHEA